MKRDTFERLKKMGIDFGDDFENLMVVPSEKMREKNSDIATPTISFKGKAPDKVEINKKISIEFLISGESRYYQNNINVELTTTDDNIKFSTSKWTNVDYGFTLKTNVIAKKEGVYIIQFKINGRNSNALNLSYYDNNQNEVSSKSTKCFCNRDFTVDELKAIVIYLRKNELVSKNSKAKRDGNGFIIYKDGQGEIPNDSKGAPIRKSKIRVLEDFTMYDYPEVRDNIFYLKQTEQLDKDDTNYNIFTKELNKAFKDYKINTCIRKIHFLSQAYLETQQFRKTYETNPNIANISGGEFYRGRGFLQLTHDYNYKSFYKKKIGKEPDNEQLKEFVPKVAKLMEYACEGSSWYWDSLKINQYADKDDARKVSASINRPKALTNESEMNNINHLEERILYVSYFKLAMDYENCKSNK